MCNADLETKISILSALFLVRLHSSEPPLQSSLSIQWLRGQYPSHANHTTSQPQLKVSLFLSPSPHCKQIFSLPLSSSVEGHCTAPTHCLYTQPGRGHGDTLWCLELVADTKSRCLRLTNTHHTVQLHQQLNKTFIFP